MTTQRAQIRWPIYGSVWAVIAALGGIRHHDWLIVALGFVAAISFWAYWLRSTSS